VFKFRSIEEAAAQVEAWTKVIAQDTETSKRS
jgi:hypothetical protein